MSTNSEDAWKGKADAALKRMRAAVKAGRGVRISREELAQLDLTILGEIMATYDDDYR